MVMGLLFVDARKISTRKDAPAVDGASCGGAPEARALSPYSFYRAVHAA